MTISQLTPATLGDLIAMFVFGAVVGSIIANVFSDIAYDKIIKIKDEELDRRREIINKQNKKSQKRNRKSDWWKRGEEPPY